jgi:predicted O-linked N-acetylglucosamine transferase (SPINDLY family)
MGKTMGTAGQVDAPAGADGTGSDAAKAAGDHPALEGGMVHHRAGRLAEAEAIYRQILVEDPREASACYLLSVVACQSGRFEDGLELADRALRLQPGVAPIWSNRGVALKGLGRNEEARESFSQALMRQPDFAEAFAGRAEALFALGRHAETVADCDAATALRPDYAEVYNCRGNALHVLGRQEDALEAYRAATRSRMDYPEAWCNLGIALYSLGRFEDSIESCDQAIRLRPELAEAHFCRGNSLQSLGRSGEALESYGHAIRLKPDFADAYLNRGITQEALALLGEALESYGNVLRLQPNHVEALNNRGAVLHKTMRYPEALASFDRAIELNADFAEAHSNRANVLLVLENYPEALKSCREAARCRPGFDWLQGITLYIRGYLCDWAGFEDEVRSLEAAILRGERVATPFIVLGACDSPAVHRRAAEIYAEAKHPALDGGVRFTREKRREKIRVAYFSADFREHATSFLMAEVFERHDRGRFEIYGFSTGPDTGDAMARRVSGAMDKYFNVADKTDGEAAELARELGVDIAVDLNGMAGQNRTGIFARRAAPIQVNYLGYPGTMGAEYMDYLIADRTVIPESGRKDYCEKIVWLPDSYQPNDSRRMISDVQRTRAGEGLPERGFVFCCFNRASKITPTVFDVWMRILERVPGSVLWLMHDNAEASANVLAEARRRGMAEERIVFARSLQLAEHLARVRLADLSLDTFPYGAHTTASDALWAGVPVLTRAGESFASRVGASLLRALGLPELIVRTDAEFEEMAVRLAEDAARLQGLRRRLAKNRLTTTLFDGAAIAGALERAYQAMYERWEIGLEPDHIEVNG